MTNDDKGEPKSRARKELDFGKELYETFLDSLAAVLALRVTTREAGAQLSEALDEQMTSPGTRPLRLPSGSELRDLAFDLAQLQVQNLRAITRIGNNHTDFLAQKLRERRKCETERAERASRREVLVRPELDASSKRYCGTFEVVNATSARGALRFPGVLTLRRSDGGQTCIAEPAFSTRQQSLACGAETKVTLAIAHDVFPADGTYLAQASISLGADHTLELFIQVDVTGARAGRA